MIDRVEGKNSKVAWWMTGMVMGLWNDILALEGARRDDEWEEVILI